MTDVDVTFLLADFESHMWQRMPVADDAMPYVGLIYAAPDGVMKAQQMAFNRATLRRIGGDLPRGRFGQFLVNVAVNLQQLPADLFATNPEMYEPGDRPLVAVCISNILHTLGVPGGEVEDFAALPAGQVREMRSLIAADGLGRAWSIRRDMSTGEIVESINGPCQPDLERPGFCAERPAETDEDVWITGAVAWGLAVIAGDARAKVAALDPAAG